jgi:hypothetical protein
MTAPIETVTFFAAIAAAIPCAAVAMLAAHAPFFNASPSPLSCRFPASSFPHTRRKAHVSRHFPAASRPRGRPTSPAAETGNTAFPPSSIFPSVLLFLSTFSFFLFPHLFSGNWQLSSIDYRLSTSLHFSQYPLK